MERTLDRLPSFDERSRGFPIRTLISASQPRSYTWFCGTTLDQGREGACVGYGWAHERAARPVIRSVTEADAFSLYNRAQELDEWAGEDYDGTSVIAGAKAAEERGWLKEYRWAFGLQDLLMAISYHGPVVLGVNWWEGMRDPDIKGFIHVTGDVIGGHCLLARGVNVPARTVLLHQSWGPDWGKTKWGPGTCLISWDDMAALLLDQGEACVPVVR